jgi:hypothetical protein
VLVGEHHAAIADDDIAIGSAADRWVTQTSHFKELPLDQPLYLTADLIEHRRNILRYARSFPPGSERNNHRKVALLFRALFNNKDWLDTHTIEGSGS